MPLLTRVPAPLIVRRSCGCFAQAEDSGAFSAPPPPVIAAALRELCALLREDAAEQALLPAMRRLTESLLDAQVQLVDWQYYAGAALQAACRAATPARRPYFTRRTEQLQGLMLEIAAGKCGCPTIITSPTLPSGG